MNESVEQRQKRLVNIVVAGRGPRPRVVKYHQALPGRAGGSHDVGARVDSAQGQGAQRVEKTS